VGPCGARGGDLTLAEVDDRQVDGDGPEDEHDEDRGGHEHEHAAALTAQG
jgi:hypothetical protein